MKKSYIKKLATFVVVTGYVLNVFDAIRESREIKDQEGAE